VALGDPAAVGKADKLRRLREALTDSLEETRAIGKKAGVSLRDAQRFLDQLLKDGEASREGVGKKSDPYRFCKFDSRRGPGLIARIELPPKDSIHAGPGATKPPARNESLYSLSAPSASATSATNPPDDTTEEVDLDS
jgi:hypothetical protein